MNEPRSTPALLGLRILIVEDEYLLAEGIKDCVEDAGAAAIGPFSSMVEALAGMAHFGAVHAAILDIGLGDQLSYPLADALDATQIPYLFLTAYDRASLPERFASTRHLQKPYAPADLIEELVRLRGVQVASSRASSQRASA